MCRFAERSHSTIDSLMDEKEGFMKLLESKDKTIEELSGKQKRLAERCTKLEESEKSLKTENGKLKETGLQAEQKVTELSQNLEKIKSEKAIVVQNQEALTVDCAELRKINATANELNDTLVAKLQASGETIKILEENKKVLSNDLEDRKNLLIKAKAQLAETEVVRDKAISKSNSYQIKLEENSKIINMLEEKARSLEETLKRKEEEFQTKLLESTDNCFKIFQGLYLRDPLTNFGNLDYRRAVKRYCKFPESSSSDSEDENEAKEGNTDVTKEEKIIPQVVDSVTKASSIDQDVTVLITSETVERQLDTNVTEKLLTEEKFVPDQPCSPSTAKEPISPTMQRIIDVFESPIGPIPKDEMIDSEEVKRMAKELEVDLERSDKDVPDPKAGTTSKKSENTDVGSAKPKIGAENLT